MVARYGGDEFVVLCPDVSGEQDAVAIARRVESALSDTFVVEGREVFVTPSIGIALGSGRDTTDSLIRSADAAMYHAKYGGRAGYAVFDSAMRDREVSRLDLTTNVRLALRRGQLRLHYQPIVDLELGRPIAFEALVRWQHPERGILAAGEFIPLIEETPLISQLGDWVLQEACAELARWQQAGWATRLSVNISARDLRTGGLVDRVERALTTTGASPRGLCLEITEHAVMSDLARASAILERLRTCGVMIALDDFGTGSSSLSELAQLPIDMLKVDRSFVDNIDVDERSRRVTALILGLAHTLELIAVAEGIERQAQLDVLRALDERLQIGQGYLLGHPQPAGSARRLLGVSAGVRTTPE
jgi:EAL domain-containing protein (putative c-di-GMP-specific phosphodiesterase class I)